VSNQQIATMITEALVSGTLVHPGDPDNNIPPRTIILPIFRTQGLPKENADLVAATARFLGEAVVHLIETSGMSIVPTAEFDDLTAITTGDVPGRRVMPVHCHCDRVTSDPLAMLTVDGRDRIVIDGKQLISALQQREADHPHRRVP
jgi:hypothetical protein